MSGLHLIKLPTKAIKVSPTAEFSVRGLSLPDILSLVAVYREDAVILFDKFAEKEDVDMNMVFEVIALAPQLVALLINLAADGDESTMETARALSVSVQADALEAIASLTFDAEGGPKKLIETVVRMMGGLTEASAAIGDSKTLSAQSSSK
ncbi:hypothetical protein LOKG_00032 [Loktanella phage pCB2051-A]|uniref:Tail assembly chaperone n=1 Tax=Loktanella phage pCB2051-A TaxID=754044 RepID=M4QRI8_9CAUD|nr:tail protein [Loktanella phage pCB2051-A]AGH31468.1 hypothetical protein LOKG_00032 [Loktanella phage pCB2051-A]